MRAAQKKAGARALGWTDRNVAERHQKPNEARDQEHGLRADTRGQSRARGQKQGTRSEAGTEGMADKFPPPPLSVAGGGKPRVPPRAQLKKKAGTTGRGMKRVIHRERLAGVAADCVRHLVTCQ